MATFSGFTGAAYALSAPSPDAYYSLGGIVCGAGASYAIEGLVEYDFGETQWSNSSSTQYGGTNFGGGTGFAILGQGLYVPIFGQQGILVFVGGDAPTKQTQNVEGEALVSMTQITIYDIRSRIFYLQNAGGTVPSSRTSFCAVGAGSAENSTWEMYVAPALSEPEVPFLMLADSYTEATVRPPVPLNTVRRTLLSLVLTRSTSSHFPHFSGLKPQERVAQQGPIINARLSASARC
jgi:hypothetical protein